MVQVTSDIGQVNLYVQADNHLGHLILEGKLLNLKRGGRVIKSQEDNSELLEVYVTQKCHWHMIIEMEWGYLQRSKSPYNIYTYFDHYLQLNLDGKSFL